MDPNDANLVSFNAPKMYFPLPTNSMPPAPIAPSVETIRFLGGFGGREEEYMRTAAK